MVFRKPFVYFQENVMSRQLTRFDPFGELARFDAFRGFDDLLRNFSSLSSASDAVTEARIRLDVSETEDAYAVSAELPGINKEDVKVTIDGNKVTIRAESRSEKETREGETVLRRERYYGAQSRSFALAQDIDEANAKASYADGVLNLHLPKKSAENGVKTLTVE